MTTLVNRPNTALLVVDVQVGVVANAHKREEVVGVIKGLVERARAGGVPVVWVQHSDDELETGSDDWQIVPELSPLADEPVVHKKFGDSFEDTDLESILAEREVGKLVVSGAQTDFCIRSTLHGAMARGYDAVLVADGHTTDDMSWTDEPIPASSIIAHTNTYWHWHRAPNRVGGTVNSTEAL